MHFAENDHFHLGRIPELIMGLSFLKLLTALQGTFIVSSLILIRDDLSRQRVAGPEPSSDAK